jgi:hypothetical protein
LTTIFDERILFVYQGLQAKTCAADGQPALETALFDWHDVGNKKLK